MSRIDRIDKVDEWRNERRGLIEAVWYWQGVDDPSELYMVGCGILPRRIHLLPLARVEECFQMGGSVTAGQITNKVDAKKV